MIDPTSALIWFAVWAFGGTVFAAYNPPKGGWFNKDADYTNFYETTDSDTRTRG